MRLKPFKTDILQLHYSIPSLQFDSAFTQNNQKDYPIKG